MFGSSKEVKRRRTRGRQIEGKRETSRRDGKRHAATDSETKSDKETETARQPGTICKQHGRATV